MFFQIVAGIQKNLRLQIAESANLTKSFPEKLGVFFVNNQTASSYKKTLSM